MEELARILERVGIVVPADMLNDLSHRLGGIPVEFLVGGVIALPFVFGLWLIFRAESPPAPKQPDAPALYEALVETTVAKSAVSDDGAKPEPEAVSPESAGTISPESAGAISPEPAGAKEHTHDTVGSRLTSLEERGGELADAVFAIRQTLKSGDYDEALTALTHLGDSEYRVARQLIGRTRTRSEGTATIKLVAGELCMKAGDHQTAARQFSQAVEVLSEEPPGLLVECLNKHGLAAYHAGRPDDAAASFESASHILEGIRGANHPDVAATLNNLAMVYQVKGDLVTAESLYRRALKIDEEVLGDSVDEGSLDVAADLNNLGLLSMRRGQYDEAMQLLQRSLKIKETLLDADHPSLESGRRNLADLRYAVDQSNAAEASN